MRFDHIGAPAPANRRGGFTTKHLTWLDTWDIMPDQFSADAYEALSADPKSLERTLSAF